MVLELGIDKERWDRPGARTFDYFDAHKFFGLMTKRRAINILSRPRFGKEGHLTLCIATIGTVRVGLDNLPDGEAICGSFGGNTSVFVHSGKSKVFFSR